MRRRRCRRSIAETDAGRPERLPDGRYLLKRLVRLQKGGEGTGTPGGNASGYRDGAPLDLHRGQSGCFSSHISQFR